MDFQENSITFVSMINLAQHIELMLLDNDCVIVPRLGGFVAHYSSALYNEDENTVIPPYRSLGFNAKLKMNDGILAESYMSSYGLTFAEATRKIDKEVDELLYTLHDEGKFDLVNIGELRYNIHGVYEFTPYDNKLVSPDIYGLDTLSIKRLSAIAVKPAEEKVEVKPEESVTEEEEEQEERPFMVRFGRTFVRSAAAVAAVIVLLFIYSTPIQNISLFSGDQARIIPNELINKLKSESLLTKTINYDIKPAAPISAKAKVVADAKRVSPTPALTTENTLKPYQLIAASSISKKRANMLVEKLHKDGFNEAQVLTGKKMIRVCIASCENESKAYTLMNKIVKTTDYKDIWVLKAKDSSPKD